MIDSVKCSFVSILLAIFCLCFVGICQAGNDVVIQWNLANYQVKRGDTLSSLSRKLGVSGNVLRAVNHLKADHVRASSTFQYPKIGITLAAGAKGVARSRSGATVKAEVVAHRLYAAKNVFYLMVVVDDTDEYRNILIFRKEGQVWRELDRFNSPYPGIFRYKPKLIVNDLNHDGNDECFYFAEYRGSSKDNGVEGLCHVPALRDNKLHGIELNIHYFNVVQQESEGSPPMSENITEIGPQDTTGYERYDAYILRTANNILGAK